MDVNHLVDNLLDSIDLVEAADNSYVNFHLMGLSYLNLLRTDRLTVKLYTFNDVQHNEQGFLVHPHNHSYNFVHRTMVGTVWNHTFDITGEGDNAENWNMYAYSTPLNGSEGGLTKLLPCGLVDLQTQQCPAGQGYYLKTDQIHTISVQGNERRYAAAVLVQFHDVEPGAPTAMFAPQGEDPDCSNGLYQRMDSQTGRRIIERYREETKT